MNTTFLKKPLATLAIIGAVGVTAGITSVATAQVASGAANAPITQTNQAAPKGRRAPGVMGTVSSINGTTIVVAGKDGTSYTVDASAATFHKAPTFVAGSKPTAPATITIADIAVGDTVSIQGTTTGTSVVAKEVMDGAFGMMGHGGAFGMGMGSHGVRGTVSAINGTTITLTNTDGTSYTIDASAASVDKIATVAVSDLKVGDTLGVEGTVSGTSVTANHITAGNFGKGPGAPSGQ